MATARWFIQGLNRSKGTYYEAVRRNPGGKGRTAALGYLSDVELAWARENLKAFGHAFDALDAVGGPSYSADEIRMALLRDPADASNAIAHAERSITQRDIAAGDYAKVTLRGFYDLVWVNVRPRDVEPGTWHREQWFWQRKILPVLGDTRIDRLDAVKWSNFLANLEGVGGRTKAIIQGCYRSMLRYLVEMQIIPAMHSFREIRGSKTRTLSRPKPLMAHEVAALLDAAPSPMHRALYAVAIGQGLRPAEVTAIRWEDVGLDAGTLYVRGTKTDLSEDTVPLTPISATELRSWWEAAGRPENGLVFVWRGHQIESWKKGLKTAAKKAGISDGRRIFPNLARHSFATLAAMGGVPKAAAKRMLRHSHASDLVETAYTHPQVDQVREAMASFPAIKAR